MKPDLPLRRILVSVAAIAVVLTSTVSVVRPEGGDKRLDRIKGQVGYATAADGPIHEVFGHDVLPDDDLAITQDKSAAELVLPDSSIVALGENTRVKVGAFSTGSAGPGSTIEVQNGTLRFDIRRPTGGTANYHFVTTTSQIAVRGTVGLLSFLSGNTTVACLACAADSVTVVTAGQTITLVTGQLVTVSATGAVVTGTVTSTALSSFSGAQVSTSVATGPGAAVSGISGLSGGALTGTVAAAAGAAAVGATVAVVASNAAPKPSPSPSPSASPSASPSPGTSPTPNAPIQIQRLPATPAPAPPAARAQPAVRAQPFAPPIGLPAGTDVGPGRRGVR